MLSFLNTGNQPIAIEDVTYTAFGSEGDPEDDCNETNLEAPSKKDPWKLSLARILRTIPPKDFKPFTVKPGEIESRTYSFAGNLASDSFQPSSPQEKITYVLACLYVQIYTEPTGRKNLEITAAKRAINGPMPTMLQSDPRQVEIVNAHWPFYLIGSLIDSWKSKKKPV